MAYWMLATFRSPYSSMLTFIRRIEDDLIDEGFLKPVYKESTRTRCGYWMHHFVRSTLEDCLSARDGKYLVSSDANDDTIYNGSADFSITKDLEFLHMGKWELSSPHHVEMEYPELFFKDIKTMDNLKYISFRGVSMIKELPKLITKLIKLKILDLKACYNLEVIPTDIGTLHFLTYLDMSECYFLDHMPASLSRLALLRVLKGFVVGETNTKNEETCTIGDLVSLTNLMKLNIYTRVKEFPSEDQLTSLHHLISLQNLTSWGGCSTKSRDQECKSTMTRRATHLEFRLGKLDLRCVPEKFSHNWLRPSNFKCLERLYIRGGQFNDLGHVQEDRKGKRLVSGERDHWNVEILRLKHLSKLQMD